MPATGPTHSLAGRHALVCGGSAGIGRAAAAALGAQGAEVTVLARTAQSLDEAVKGTLAAGAPAARPLVADLDDTATACASVAQLLADHGPVHILINNAGGAAPGPLLDADEALLLAAQRRHLLAAHGLTRLVLPGMAQAGFGRIINVLATSVREPLPPLGVSNITRGAMASWAKTLSRELPPGVTINNVLPGATATDRLHTLVASRARAQGRQQSAVEAEWVGEIPEGRFAQPAELGAVIAFLASPAAAYIRGVSLPVDGGRLRSL